MPIPTPGDLRHEARIPVPISHSTIVESSRSVETPFGTSRADILSWFRSLSFFQQLSLFAIAFFFASPFGVNRILVYNELFVGDAILVPCIFIFLFTKSATLVRRELFGDLKSLAYLLLLFLFIGGVIATAGDIVASFTDFRCACLILSFYFLCRSKDERVRINSIYIAGVMAIASFFASAVYYKFFPPLEVGVKNYYPSYGISLLAVIAVYEETPFLPILGFLLSLYIAATSFYRSLMFTPILFLLILVRNLFRDISHGGAQSRRNAFVTSTFFLVGALSSGFVIQLIIKHFNANEGTIDQGINKLDNLLRLLQGKGLSEGDDLRAVYLDYIGSHFSSFLLPSGFGHKAIIGHWGPIWADDSLKVVGANSLDGMHLFFLCHFGAILTFLILTYLAIRLSTSLLLTKGSTFAIRALILFFILADAFVTASPFALISNALFCGAAIGCITFRPAMRANG